MFLITKVVMMFHQVFPPPFRGGQLKPYTFNENFVAAYRALNTNTSGGLRRGLELLIESLSISGPYAPRLKLAIEALYCALSQNERADKDAHWNRDFSGYGKMSWRSNFCGLDEALSEAWTHIDSINRELLRKNFGQRR